MTPGLEDLGALMGMEPKKPTDNKKRGYDGNVVVVKVRTEKRRGKLVTIAWGFESKPKELDALLATCKKTLGTGGQVVDNSLEIQGDHVERMKQLLKSEGWAVHGSKT